MALWEHRRCVGFLHWTSLGLEYGALCGLSTVVPSGLETRNQVPNPQFTYLMQGEKVKTWLLNAFRIPSFSFSLPDVGSVVPALL